MPSPESQAEKENATSLNTSKQVALLPTQADSADFSEIAELGTKFIKEKGEAGYPPPMPGQDYTLMVDSETWYGTDWVHHQNAAKAMTHIEPWMVAAIKMHESAPACGAKSAIGILTLFIVETSLGRDTLIRTFSENNYEYEHGIWQDIQPENSENASEDMRQLVDPAERGATRQHGTTFVARWRPYTSIGDDTPTIHGLPDPSRGHLASPAR